MLCEDQVKLFPLHRKSVGTCCCRLYTECMARIFVIEDNEGLRTTICSYLELEEHDVYPFTRLSGVEDAVRMQRPDLLILDVMLPDGDGFLSARKIRRHSEVPIIFLTARSSESDWITGFEVGGDGGRKTQKHLLGLAVGTPYSPGML